MNVSCMLGKLKLCVCGGGGKLHLTLGCPPDKSSLQCYSVLSDILVKNELCIPLERGSNVLSTGEGFICLFPPS